MLSCREITRLASDGLDHELPLTTRMGMRLHFMMCRHCSRYAAQLEQLRQILASYSGRGVEGDEGLSDEARQRITCCLEQKVRQ